MRQSEKIHQPGDFDALFSCEEVVEALKAVSPAIYDAAAEFWRVPLEGAYLSPRVKELILFAMHASASALNVEAMNRQIDRALAYGATPGDLVDVLISIAGLANHALYSSVPVLLEELQAAGIECEDTSQNAAGFAAAKERFVKIRQFWNADRDSVALMMPEYFSALTDLSVSTWEHGSLSRKEREFVCIAIDCTVTHSYPTGLRIHIRNALAQGASQGEILEIFQLAATMGLEAYRMSAEKLFANGRRTNPV